MKLKLQRGDIVEWTSQSGGHVRTKCGHIVEVVLPMHVPKRKPRNAGLMRDHESYVVMAHVLNGTKAQRKRFRSYWPRISQLKLMETSDGRNRSTDREAPG